MTTAGDELDPAVALAITGDRRAIGYVLEQIRPLVFRYCRARVGLSDRGQHTADDVAQEVCMAVLKALPRYQDQGRPFMAFVYGIAAHKVADAHRSSSRNKADVMSDIPDVISNDHGPEQRAIEAEQSGQMKALLGTLSEKHREIVIHRIVEGRSAEETAEIVGSTPGAVRVAQHRAMAKLKAEIMKAGELYG